MEDTNRSANLAETKKQVAELLIRALAVMGSRMTAEEQAGSRLYALLNLGLAAAVQEAPGVTESLQSHGPQGYDLRAHLADLATMPKIPSDGDRHAMTLAKAIREAGIKVGMVSEDAALTGTHLLLIIDDMAKALQNSSAPHSRRMH